jgi:hypothetical protein
MIPVAPEIVKKSVPAFATLRPLTAALNVAFPVSTTQPSALDMKSPNEKAPHMARLKNFRASYAVKGYPGGNPHRYADRH